MKSTKPYSTFGLNSFAQDIICFSDIAELKPFIGKQNTKEILVLGEGSNTIFMDDYQGTVLINQIKGIEITQTDAHWYLSVGAGENWHELVKYCVNTGIKGFENLALIPGTVGACPIQNIGAYGIEVAQFIESVDYFDLQTGNLCRIQAENCEFGYRSSIFKQALKFNAIISRVNFKLNKHWSASINYGDLQTLDDPSALEVFIKVCEIRKAKLPDPKKVGNAGSFFKNPVVSKSVYETLCSRYSKIPAYPVDDHNIKIAAGWLIDQAGLKGYRHNTVGVHDAQALVLIRTAEEATGEALVHLCGYIQQQVNTKFGLMLAPEVRLMGMFGETQLSELTHKN